MMRTHACTRSLDLARVASTVLALLFVVSCIPSSQNPVPGTPDAAGDGSVPTGDGGAPLALNVAWNHGSADCNASSDPPLQIFRFDADTYILRQNKCIHYEAPFLYLLFGSDRVLLEDTGATSSAASFPVRDTVQSIIAGWASEHGKSAPALIVTHSHGHGDHTAGDGQFTGQPGTTVVPATVPALQSFFAIASWPEQITSYDLGGRILDILAIPGHQDAHIAIHDRKTGILLTGDTLYPGRLYVRDFPAYRASIARLVDFTATRPVRYVLGTHIEMTRSKGVDYPVGTTFQPDEHPLELTRDHLVELDSALRAMSTPVRQIHDSFIIDPVQ